MAGKNIYEDSPFFMPASHTVDLSKTQADLLLIHDSSHLVQSAVDALTADLPIGTYDRLAFPTPSENIRDSRLVSDWVEVLHHKHGFERIVLAEAPNFMQSSARNVLRKLITCVDVEIDTLEEKDLDLPTSIEAHCADLRFQAVFNEHIADLSKQEQFSSYIRYSWAGGSLAVANTAVVQWVDRPLRVCPIDRVDMYNHIDCAITGGQEAHG